MNYTQHIQKWGNATGIRLPKKALQAARWQEGQTVSINVHGDSITLTPTKPIKRQVPKLADLLKGVTPEQLHGQWDWGTDVGSEIIDDDYSR